MSMINNIIPVSIALVMTHFPLIQVDVTPLIEEQIDHRNVTNRAVLCTLGLAGWADLSTLYCWGLLLFCDFYLQFIPPINLWNNCIDLRLYLKCFEVRFFRPLRLNFEAATTKFCNQFWKFGCQPRKSKTDLCMTNGCKVLTYLTLISF